MTFAYDGAGRLTTITDTLGRPIQVSYDFDGFISTVTDFIGRQVRYEHYQAGQPGGSFGDLRSSTSPVVIGTPNGNDFPAGKTTIYTYSEDLFPEERNHNLLTVTDPRVITFLVNSYADSADPAEPHFDRLERQTLPSGAIDYVYVHQTPSPANDFATTKTIVNDRAGNVRETFFDADNQLVSLEEYTGRAPSPSSPTNDLYNRPQSPLRPDDPPLFATHFEYGVDSLLARIVRPAGNSVEYVYELDLNPGTARRLQGNLREVHRFPGALGGDQTEIIESFEYEPGFGGAAFVESHTDGRSFTTQHDYDPAGNRIHTEHRLPSIVEDWEYNSSGQVTAHTLPDNATGAGSRRRDEYTYYASGPQRGYVERQIVDALGFALTTTYEYDAVGNVVRHVDARGHDTLYSVNALDQVVRETSREVTTGSGVRHVRDTHYDANDNVVRLEVENRDELGNLEPDDRTTTIYQYDGLDRRISTMQEVEPGFDVVTVHVHDANDNTTLTRYGEATGGLQPANTLRHHYDERDLVLRDVRAELDPGASTIQHDYDGNGNRKALRDNGSRVTTYAYDGYDRLISSIDPMGNVTTQHYDENGNVVSRRIEGELTDVPGGGGNVRLSEVIYAYDAMDRVFRIDESFFDTQTQTIILDGLSTTRVFYTNTSQIRRIEDDILHATTIDYDTANRRRTVTDAKLNTITYSYDANSNLVGTTEVDKSDLGSADETFATTNTYDNLDRLRTTVDNLAHTRSYGYDSRGNRVVEVDERNNETRYAYDGSSRLVRTVRDMNGNGASALDPPDIVTDQSWDRSSRLTSLTDDNLNVTRYAYDALDRRIITKTADERLHQVGSGASWPSGQPDPDPGFTSGYDVWDNALQVTDANGSVISSGYDDLDRLTSRSIAPGGGVIGPPTGTGSESYQYDGLSRMIRAQNDGSIVTRRYDSLSNVTRETLQVPPAPVRTTTFVYDGDSRLTRTTYPGARVVTRSYDGLHRPILIRDDPPLPGSTIAFHFYKGWGRIERRDYGNDTRLELFHDPVRRPQHFGYSRISTAVHFDDRDYLWDQTDNKTAALRVLPPPVEHRQYGYDAANRLLSSQVIPSPPIQYALDGVGNRTSVVNGSAPGPYTMDSTLPEPADFQMNQYSTTPVETSRTHDPNGNLVQSVASLSRTFGYDYRDQLVQFQDPNTGQSATYVYDALGRRVQKVVNGITTRFYYDGTDEIEEQNSAHATVATYVWGFGPGLLQMLRGGQKYFYHADDQGSPVKVTDASGNVVEQYSYEDYGKPSFFNGAGAPIGATSIGNSYLYHARRHDHESSLALVGSRARDYRTGDYEQRADTGPWGDFDWFGNARAFAANNPLSVEPPAAHSGVDWSSPPGWRIPEMYAGRIAAHAERHWVEEFSAPLRVEPKLTFVTGPGSFMPPDVDVGPSIRIWDVYGDYGSPFPDPIIEVQPLPGSGGSNSGSLWSPGWTPGFGGSAPFDPATMALAPAAARVFASSNLVGMMSGPDLPTNDGPLVTMTTSGFLVPRHSCAFACGGKCEGKTIGTATTDGRCTKGLNGPMTDKAKAAEKKAAENSWKQRVEAKMQADDVCAPLADGCRCQGDYFTWLPGTKCTTVEEPTNQCVCTWETRYIGMCQ
jgi:YD repeat-containing protein